MLQTNTVIDTPFFLCYNLNTSKGKNMDKLKVLDAIYDGLKFKDAVYSEKANVCTVDFLYNPDSFKPTEEAKQKIYQTLNEEIGNFVKYDLNLVSCPLDKRTIANYTYTTITNNFPAMNKEFGFDDITVEINHMKVDVRLKLAPSTYEYATELNRAELVAQKLSESFFAEFNVIFEKKEQTNQSQKSYIENNAELMESIKINENKTIYHLSDITDIIGKNDYTTAMDYSKIKTAMENVSICGEVTNVQRKTYTRKYTRNGETQEVEKAFYNVAIRNDGKIMYCSIFPKQSDESKGDLIEIGMKVCMYGSFREYNGKLNFTANTIARCNYTKDEIKGAKKQVNEEYHTVFPQEYIDYEQKGLFDEEDKVFDGTYVVFDLETTGLEANKDEIIEIGACKVEQGRITQTFSTFVKPSKHIPREITELTGINDAMVADAPTINYVLPDFYKFCYGTTMVGHNVSFDIGFIYNVAKKLSYDFNNPLMDTIEMARKKLPGLKNYKLGTVVERLKIVLDNAHRAINDATATAKVFIKLM